MEILGFVVSVWGAVIAGLFLIAMIIGCTFDRHNNVSVKWWVVFFAGAIYLGDGWLNNRLPDWHTFLSRDLWVFTGTYLAIGLGYSIIEFMLNVRKSERSWAARWKLWLNESRSKYESKNRKAFTTDTDAAGPSMEDIANSFVANHGRGTYDLITIDRNRNPETAADQPVVPKVNRVLLTRFLGAWIVFWPFYAISLIIGDLFLEICRGFSALFAKLSGRFVRLIFRDTFKV